MGKIRILLIALASFMLSFSFIYVQIHYFHLPTIIPSPIDKELSLTIIISSHNQEQHILDLFHSIFQQSYKNYQVIFIDDGSYDATYSLAKKIVQDFQKENIVTIKRYQKRKGSVGRFYENIINLPDNTVVVCMEGNTYFAHQDVLKKINHIYASSDTWLAYGQQKELFSRKKSSLHLIKSTNLFSNSMRKKYWKRPMLKTFYAGLFKKVALSDFFFRGELVEEPFDYAYMFPMLEMAANHVLCTRDVLALYHDYKHIDKKRACFRSPYQCQRYIRRSLPYEPLLEPPYLTKITKRGQADVILFSFDSPLQLHALLESINYFMTGIHQISVLYRSSDIRHEQSYDKIKKLFPRVQFIKQSELPHTDFKPLLMQIIFGSTQKYSQYLLFATDELIIKDFVDLNKCIAAMENTKSSFFSLSLGKHIAYTRHFPVAKPSFLSIAQKIIGWQLNKGEKEWADNYNAHLTVYRKKDIFPYLQKIAFTSPKDLLHKWNMLAHQTISKYHQRRRTGLCFIYSKAISLPYSQYSSDELFQKYEQGSRIYIDPLFQIKNNSFLVDTSLPFIEREAFDLEQTD
ncbi:MAG: glycosyltransferase family 2 protein [Parachlamydiales bacterium]|nr:glycosyltransferase family 2 protein [Parachlamydiales bacterium]